METLSSNGNGDSNQTPGDVLAVCTNCNRLSQDLKSCDKCGGTLSDDTPPEPKRARLSESPVATNNDTTTTSIISVTTTASSATTTNDIRPQALFLNVNNQIMPVISLSVSAGVTPMVTTSQIVVGSSAVNAAATSTIARTTRQASAVPVSLVYNGGTVSLVQSNVRPAQQLAVTARTNSQITLPSYNLQPPPPPFSSNIARLPVVVSSSASIPVTVAPNIPTHSTQNCQVTAVEIRIGCRKFRPISPVTFKDEGVLFMLKDFTYAPVLLNTRAIIRCRANLSTCGYPVLFLYLENSCMRQIRNIFGLASNEFSCTSPVEIRRCISIFPVFGYDNRGQALSMAYSIKRTFDAMVRRYPRSTPILEEITNEVVIDTLMDSTSTTPASTSVTASVVETTQTSRVAIAGANPSSTTSTSLPSVVSTVTIQSSTNGRLSNNAAVVTASSADRSVSQQLLNGISHITHSQSSSSISITSTSASQQQQKQAQGGSSPQVLVIPQDAARWQALQKNLVVGGVYNVMVHTGQRKYCLWNGTQLVPCMVQNTEVQLNCTSVRVGSLITKCVGQVRIRAEPSSGVFFTVKGDACGQHEISITPDDILSCDVCFGKTTIIFISLSWAATDKLRKKLGMDQSQFDPTGSSQSSKYMILFLKDVNTDQEDAIKQLKFSQNQSQPALQVVDLVVGICRLAQIKKDIRGSAEAYDYLNREKLQGPAGFEKLAADLCDGSKVSGCDSGDDDDDDDDVIMTQEEIGIKCPYTQQVMVDPVRNKVCGHNYEKLAILEFIVRRKGNAKCPYAGCSQTVPLKTEDLVENVQLKEYIKKLQQSAK